MSCYIAAQFPPQKTIRETQKFSVEVGENATLYCISNHPNSTYTWKHDESLLQIANHSRFSLIIDGVLQIHNVVETDGGLYECAASAIYPHPTVGKQIRSTMFILTVYSESVSIKTNICATATLTVCSSRFAQCQPDFHTRRKSKFYVWRNRLVRNMYISAPS